MPRFVSWKGRREERRAAAAGLAAAAAATAAAAGAKVLVRLRLSASGGGLLQGRLLGAVEANHGLLAPSLGQEVPLAEVLLHGGGGCVLLLNRGFCNVFVTQQF